MAFLSFSKKLHSLSGQGGALRILFNRYYRFDFCNFSFFILFRRSFVYSRLTTHHCLFRNTHVDDVMGRLQHIVGSIFVFLIPFLNFSDTVIIILKSCEVIETQSIVFDNSCLQWLASCIGVATIEFIVLILTIDTKEVRKYGKFA